ncbi:hypothetical protein OWV82_007657 [Melia azedarach]|uniref:Uncharacterized protein n=1 Tax=Melia azedarach TaxID=155640 RepID=A0ACC1Y7J1_MELAZ|nr:hypothetical protein OWV82_007657 [Melia azedarach]
MNYISYLLITLFVIHGVVLLSDTRCTVKAAEVVHPTDSTWDSIPSHHVIHLRRPRARRIPSPPPTPAGNIPRGWSPPPPHQSPPYY